MINPKFFIELWLPFTHRAGWRIAGVYVALREGGSIRIEFSFGAFLCFKTKKSG
jgi:hypothetical protein